MNLLKFSLFVFILLVQNVLGDSEHSKPKDTDTAKPVKDEFLDGRIGNEIHPFRTKKANMLWEKAKEHVGGRKMDRLYSELMKHDQETLHLKSIVHAGLDEDGSRQEEHKKKLMKILHRYHLEDVLPSEWLQALGPEQNEALEELPELAGSQKLNKLYIRAKEQGFSDIELKNLREELGHHKKRIDDWDVLKDEIVDHLNSNSVDPSEEDTNVGAIKDKRQKLSLEHQRIKRDYDELHSKIHNATGPHNTFVESRVAELWYLAQGANFSSDELVSLKEELGHFEHRVKKQRYLTDEARMAEAKALALEEEERKHPEAEHNKMWDRAQTYSHKVRKSYNEIRHRIEKQTMRHGGEL